MDPSLDQIGKRLREAREKAEMSVDDVVYRAKIPRTVVEALEIEDFSVFTSPTYAKSFLRQYSEFLHVDAEAWLSELVPAAYVSGEGLQPMFGSDDEAPVARRTSSSRESRKSEKHETVAANGSNWSAVWLMLLTAGLVAGGVLVYKDLDKKFSQSDEKKPSESAMPEKPTAPVASSAASVVPVPHPEGVQVTLSPDQVKKDEQSHTPPRAIIVRD